jgi:hypothetical protein
VARSVNSSAKVRFECSYVWLPPKLPLTTGGTGSTRDAERVPTGDGLWTVNSRRSLAYS